MAVRMNFVFRNCDFTRLGQWSCLWMNWFWACRIANGIVMISLGFFLFNFPSSSMLNSRGCTECPTCVVSCRQLVAKLSIPSISWIFKLIMRTHGVHRLSGIRPLLCVCTKFLLHLWKYSGTDFWMVLYFVGNWLFWFCF